MKLDGKQAEDGTLEALRRGLESMRQQRDDLDQKIRACERFLKAPTKSTPITGTEITKRAYQKKNGSRKPNAPLTLNNVRAALYSDSHQELYCRGQVVDVLLRHPDRNLMSINEIGDTIRRTNGIVGYAVRTAPRGLFRTERDGNRLLVGLTNTGAEMATHAMESRKPSLMTA